MNKKKFNSNILNNCKWSKDPQKKYNQIRHFLNNNQKYNLNISDMIKLVSDRNDLYREIKKT